MKYIPNTNSKCNTGLGMMRAKKENAEKEWRQALSEDSVPTSTQMGLRY